MMLHRQATGVLMHRYIQPILQRSNPVSSGVKRIGFAGAVPAVIDAFKTCMVVLWNLACNYIIYDLKHHVDLKTVAE